MSSSRGTSNSNKTAHVMNLLRKNTPQPPSDPTVSEQPPTAVPAPQTPPIITALHADAEVSSKIRDALSEALAEEESLAANQAPLHPEPTAVQHPASPAAPPPVCEVEADPQPAPATAPAPYIDEPAASLPLVAEPIPEPVQELEAPQAAEQPSESPASAPPTTDDRSDTDDAVLINVMERLANEKVDKYIGLFGLCTCARCRRDVLALTLNVLPSKYVVMPEWEFSIRFDMYANRYSSALTAELLRACKEVMDNPRH